VQEASPVARESEDHNLIPEEQTELHEEDERSPVKEILLERRNFSFEEEEEEEKRPFVTHQEKREFVVPHPDHPNAPWYREQIDILIGMKERGI
jgi:hypothetical protein